MNTEEISGGPAPAAARASKTIAPAYSIAGSALTLAVPIQRARADELETYLRSIGDAIDDNPEYRFDKLQSVHFMRWVVVREGPKVGKNYLIFESNHDGTVDDHLRDLLRAGPKALRHIYGHCEGCVPGQLDDAGFLAFLKRHCLPYEAFYAAYPGKLAQRVSQEDKLRQALQNYLDLHDTSLRQLPPEQIYSRLKEHANALGLLAPLAAPEHAPGRSRAKTLLSLLPSVAWFATLLPVLLPVLLYKERTDVPWEPGTPVPDRESVPELKSQEDRVVQNQLTHVVAVKPGPVRRYLLRFVLGSIDRLARNYFNQGDLGGIPTIHFARWVLLEEENLLVFFSNYDGSWENYLGDFIDLAARGLTSVWTNTEGFPRTRFLVGLGALDEERFKAWTRAHQVYTEVWYSAHPQLTVKNVLQNSAIARGLCTEPANTQAKLDWLALL